jgi:hypothetical protein
MLSLLTSKPTFAPIREAPLRMLASEDHEPDLTFA